MSQSSHLAVSQWYWLPFSMTTNVWRSTYTARSRYFVQCSCYCDRGKLASRLNKIGTLIAPHVNMKNTEIICLLARSGIIRPYVGVTNWSPAVCTSSLSQLLTKSKTSLISKICLSSRMCVTSPYLEFRVGKFINHHPEFSWATLFQPRCFLSNKTPEELQTRLVDNCTYILLQAQAIQASHQEVLTDRLASVTAALNGIQSHKDQNLFIDLNIRPFSLPSDWSFEPCTSHYDTASCLILSRCRHNILSERNLPWIFPEGLSPEQTGSLSEKVGGTWIGSRRETWEWLSCWCAAADSHCDRQWSRKIHQFDCLMFRGQHAREHGRCPECIEHYYLWCTFIPNIFPTGLSWRQAPSDVLRDLGARPPHRNWHNYSSTWW